MLEGLKTDFEKMVTSGMFYTQQPIFNHLMQRLTLLEEAINNST